MPRQRNRYSRRTYPLKRFQEESGLSWSEIARRLETYRHTVLLVLQRRVMRKHAQVFFFSYGPFIMGDSLSFVASFKIRPRVTL